MLLDRDLIIFDCDGVLVDTEPLTTRLVAEVVTDAGWPIDVPYVVEHFKGKSLDLLCDRVAQQLGRPVPELADTYRDRMYGEMQSGAIEPIGGAKELLDALDALPAPIQRCVASNGPRRKMAISLTSAGLADRFGGMDSPAILSAYDIDTFKPDPALFLHAAERFKADPARCLVLEDSETGIEAAVAAGMPVIGVGGMTPPDKLRALGADRVVVSLAELVPLS